MESPKNFNDDGETTCKKEQLSVEDIIEDLDLYYSRLPGVNFHSDSSLNENNSHGLYSKSEEYSYALSSFSLGDVDSFLREDTDSARAGSLNTNEDDDIAEELTNLNDLEKKLARELEIAESTPTPERKRSLNYMNNSETWVSHTPSGNLSEYNDTEEDFASAAEPQFRSPSPPNTFEKFFFPFDNKTDTSNFALAARRINTTTSRKLQSTRSIASESAVTEDFASATDNISVASDLDEISLDDSVQKGTLFNDILGKRTIVEETPEDDYEMSKYLTTMKTAVAPVPATKPAPVKKPVVKETTPEPEPEPIVPTPEPEPEPEPEPTTPVEETKEFDVIENVYEGAKSVWAFGKNIIVFKPFMGVAEGAATKVLSITTGIESLEEADKQIKSTIAGVDKDIIDPAILKLIEVLKPIIGKGDEVVKSVLGVVSKNVPLLEGGETETETTEEVTKESPEAIAPETSTPAVIA